MIYQLKKNIDLLVYPSYLLLGRKPWAPGCFAYHGNGWSKTSPESLADATFFDQHQDVKYDDNFAAGVSGVVCKHLVA